MEQEARQVVRPVPFTAEEVESAGREWNFNCGPGALCGLLGLRPEVIRPDLLEFERKGYTNPTLMLAIIRRLGHEPVAIWRHEGGGRPGNLPEWPMRGVVRVQWGGPWCAEGRPVRARYRHTHWIAVRHDPGCVATPAFMDARLAFDINLTHFGWLTLREVWFEFLPWLARETNPKFDGSWWATHCIEVR